MGLEVDADPAMRRWLQDRVDGYHPTVVIGLFPAGVDAPPQLTSCQRVVTRDEAALVEAATSPDTVVVLLGHQPLAGALALQRAGLVGTDRERERQSLPHVIALATPEETVALGELLGSLDALHAVVSPLTPPAELGALVRRACRDRETASRCARLEAELARRRRAEREAARTLQVSGHDDAAPPRPVGGSGPMQATLEMVELAASARLPVLLTGETGAGKGHLARLIHDRSERARAAFVVVDCGAIAESLAESELFGHERGAFTGAETTRTGLLELADGGTLFLDEIQNLPRTLQAKLLGALQEGRIRPVGGNRWVPIDVRLIVASNEDLEELVRQGRFRPDLYYRLRVLRIVVPPLRERPGDIALLARQFLEQMHRELGEVAPRTFAREAESLLLQYGWPGNVRELASAVRVSSLLARGKASIGAAQVRAALPELRTQAPPETATGRSWPALRRHLDELERQHLKETLARHGGVVTRAAAELTVPVTTLRRRLRALQQRR